MKLPLSPDARRDAFLLLERIALILENSDTAMLPLLLNECGLAALIFSDSLEEGSLPEELPMRHELARRLREAGLDWIDAQSGETEAVTKKRLIQLHDILELLHENAELPFPVPKNAPSPLLPAFSTALQQSEENEDLLLFRLKAEIAALREALTSLVLQRDRLFNVERKELEAALMREYGPLEAEAYRSECEAQELKRRLALIQASLNRAKTPRQEEVEQELARQYEAYRRAYEDFVRRVNEAADYEAERERRRKERQRQKSPGAAPGAAGDGGDKKEEQVHGDPGKEDPETSAGKAEAERLEAPAEEDDEERELKRLYRRIVKAMHPDLHPHQDEATRDLFKEAILSYKRGDLDRLQEIDAMLSGLEPEEAETGMEALLREKERLLELIRAVRAEIALILSKYPFSARELLEDPVRMEQAKQILRNRIETAKAAAEAYRKRIEELSTE